MIWKSPDDPELTLDDVFEAYHRARPEIGRYFCETAEATIESGDLAGGGEILGSVRYSKKNKVSASNEQYKVNDRWRSRYVRLFEALYPEHKGFFTIRRPQLSNKIRESDRKSYAKNVAIAEALRKDDTEELA